MFKGVVVRGYGAAANELFRRHLPLAEKIAANLCGRYRWLSSDELYSFALSGLSHAAQAYDPSHGVPFALFARRKGMFWAIDQMRKEGLLRRSDCPGPRFVSLDISPAESNTVEIPDRSPPHNEPLESRELSDALLDHLEGTDRAMLMMYYADGLTFREIAAIRGLSESSVCARHKTLLDKLRRVAAGLNLG